MQNNRALRTKRIALSPQLLDDEPEGAPEHWGVRRAYLQALAAQGAEPVLLPPNDLDAAVKILKQVDGLILTGGPDLDPRLYGQEPTPELGRVVPERDELELAAANFAIAQDLPVLGICRGAQVGAVALGGTLFQDLPTAGYGQVGHYHGREAHSVNQIANSWLLEAFSESFAVNSYHHQAIDDPGKLQVVATAEDGVTEAAFLAEHSFFWLVQWHPELMPSHWGLFAALIQTAQHK